jgi:hypothetical protein
MDGLGHTPSDRARLQRLRNAAKPIALSALAAGLAWVIAYDLVGHAAPSSLRRGGTSTVALSGVSRPGRPR